jgi:hypothetical protein
MIASPSVKESKVYMRSKVRGFEGKDDRKCFFNHFRVLFSASRYHITSWFWKFPYPSTKTGRFKFDGDIIRVSSLLIYFQILYSLNNFFLACFWQIRSSTLRGPKFGGHGVEFAVLIQLKGRDLYLNTACLTDLAIRPWWLGYFICEINA